MYSDLVPSPPNDLEQPVDAMTDSRLLEQFTVSVVVPTKNRRHTLPRALDSVAAQTRPVDELLVVDDASSDGTAEMVRREFPGVRLLSSRGGGPSAARNLGAAKARGDWIGFLDSDDAWSPTKLERQLAALAKSPEYLVCHTDEIWIRNGRRVNPMKKHAKRGGRIFRHCLPRCSISPSSVLLRKSLFEELGGFDPDLPVCEDYDLWLRICSLHPVLYVNEKLTIKYGGHDDQLSRQYWGMDRYRIRAIEKILATDALSRGDRLEALETALEKTQIYLIGARKRGKDEEVALYEGKKSAFQQLFERLESAPESS